MKEFEYRRSENVNILLWSRKILLTTICNLLSTSTEELFWYFCLLYIFIYDSIIIFILNIFEYNLIKKTFSYSKELLTRFFFSPQLNNCKQCLLFTAKKVFILFCNALSYNKKRNNLLNRIIYRKGKYLYIRRILKQTRFN